MKRIVLVAMVFISTCATVFAQSKIPAAVTEALSQRFSGSTGAKWSKENAHEYEAEFTWLASKFSASFSDKGEWLQTESPATFIQLPVKVQQAFNASYKGTTAKDVSKIETSTGKTLWEIEIAKDGKTVEKFYTPEGEETKE